MNYHIPMTRAQAEFRQKNAGENADDKSELDDVMRALAARDAEIKAFATKADGEIKEHGKILGETKSTLERLAQDGTGLQQRLLDVEHTGGTLPAVNEKDCLGKGAARAPYK